MPGSARTAPTSARRSEAVCTQPASVTHLRDVVTQIDALAKRGSLAIAVFTRSLISGSRLYAPPGSQVPSIAQRSPRSDRLRAHLVGGEQRRRDRRTAGESGARLCER